MINLPAIIASSPSVAPVSSIIAELPPWLEAGVVGVLFGGFIGFWLAVLYRHRARRAFRRAQRQMVTNALRSVRPKLTVFPVASPASSELTANSLDEHVDALRTAIGTDATAEWSAELHRQQSRLVRLHRALE
ncbi:MAG: hypothetical protein AB7O26_18280 [Planctomycetaceae bacterium]